MDDDALYEAIVSGLHYIDSAHGKHYRSASRAEYLERMLFLCPRCGSTATLRSEGAHVHCDACGMAVEYGEDLHFHSADEAFPYPRAVDWYNAQKLWVAQREIEEDTVIWHDEGITACRYNGTERLPLGECTLTLTDKTLSFGEVTIPVANITAATIISGAKLSITAGDEGYLLQGHPRFNAIKYVLLFNRLETAIKENNYYSLHPEQ